jgi:hypothetical protein
MTSNAPDKYGINSQLQLKNVPKVGNDLVGILGISADGTIQNISFDQQIKATKQSGLSKFISSQVLYNILNQNSNPLYQTNNTQNIGGSIVNIGGNVFNNSNNATNNTFITSGGQSVNVVQTLDVTAVNGFTGIVNTIGSAASLSMGISVGGMLKGVAGAITAAVAGTDYLIPSGVWTTAAGGTLTGANTITANSGNFLTFNGVWTASLALQYGTAFTGTFTGRPAQALDSVIGVQISTALVTGTNGQKLTGLYVNPSFTGTGSFLAAYFGDKVQFTTSSSRAAINIDQNSVDPSSNTSGDIWYNSTLNQFRINENGTVSGMIGWRTSGSTNVTTPTINGSVTFTQPALTSAWQPVITFNAGAHTLMTASTEFPDYVFGGSAHTWLAGTIATQRFAWFKSSSVVTGLATDAYTLYADAPTGNITRAWGLGLTGNIWSSGKFMFANSGTSFIGSEIGLIRKDQSAETIGLIVNNQTNGASSAASIYVTSQSAVSLGIQISTYSSSSGTSGMFVAGSAVIAAGNAQGFNIGPTGTGILAFWVNAFKRFSIDSLGQFTYIQSSGVAGTSVFQTFTQQAQASGTPNGLLWSAAAHTGTTAVELIDWNINLARTVQFTGSTGFTTQRAFLIQAPTYAFVSATGTITDAATFCINGAPIAGTNAAITRSHALWVVGKSRIDGDLNFRAGATANVGTDDNQSLVFKSNATSRYTLFSDGRHVYQNGPSATSTWISYNQTVVSGGNPRGLEWVAAGHVNSTAVELIDIRWILSRTVQFTSNTGFAAQRAFVIEAPTYSFVSATGTIVDSATFAITGAPIKGTNAALTNTHGLLIQAGAVGAASNSFGLTVNAQTGATNNYAAQFLGGKVLTSASTTTSAVNIGSFAGDPSVPVNGDLVYNSTLNALRAYINSAWVSLGAGGGGGWAVTGTTTITGTTNQTGAFVNTFNLNGIVVSQNVITSGSPTALSVIGGAHTTLTAAEVNDVNYNLARVVQFTGSTGFTTQRALLIQAPTYAFVSATGTITNAYTFYVDGAPIVGTNAAITNRYAAYLGGQIIVDGQITIGAPTNASGVQIIQAGGSGSNVSLNMFTKGAGSMIINAGNTASFSGSAGTTIGGTNITSGAAPDNSLRGIGATSAATSAGRAIVQGGSSSITAIAAGDAMLIGGSAGVGNADGGNVIIRSGAGFGSGIAGVIDFQINLAHAFAIDSNKNFYGTSGTTGMNNGFIYIPAAAGAPSGTPSAVTGTVAMYYDTTNNNFYIYNGAWKKVLLT